jgi:hypothetical protein
MLDFVPLVDLRSFVWYCFGARGVPTGSTLSLCDSDRQICPLRCSWHLNSVSQCGKRRLPRELSATGGCQTSKTPGSGVVQGFVSGLEPNTVKTRGCQTHVLARVSMT